MTSRYENEAVLTLHKKKKISKKEKPGVPHSLTSHMYCTLQPTLLINLKIAFSYTYF